MGEGVPSRFTLSKDLGAQEERLYLSESKHTFSLGITSISKNENDFCGRSHSRDNSGQRLQMKTLDPEGQVLSSGTNHLHDCGQITTECPQAPVSPSMSNMWLEMCVLLSIVPGILAAPRGAGCCCYKTTMIPSLPSNISLNS